MATKKRIAKKKVKVQLKNLKPKKNMNIKMAPHSVVCTS
jgi:hypothetical protein